MDISNFYDKGWRKGEERGFIVLMRGEEKKISLEMIQSNDAYFYVAFVPERNQRVFANSQVSGSYYNQNFFNRNSVYKKKCKSKNISN